MAPPNDVKLPMADRSDAACPRAAESASSVRPPTGSRGVTLRALLVGAVLTVALTAGEPYGVMVIHGSALCADFSTGGAIFLFFILIFVFNGALRRIRPRLGFDTGELVTVYVMLVLGSAVPSWGFTMNMMGLIGGMHYYASPENRWSETILPHLKEWIAPKDELALKYFF